MAIFELDAETRSDVGKGASRRLRREKDLVPAIVYGASEKPEMISLMHHKILKALDSEAFYSHILTINLNKKSQQVVLKDVQRHPFKPRILHVDFLRVRADEELTRNVPLHFIHGDTAPGVKLGGGSVLHYLNEVEIQCLPKDLPEFIEVDLGNVELDQTLHLSDIQLPANVKFAADLTDPQENEAVATIHIPRVVEEPVEVAAPVETEILTEKKEDEAGAEGKEPATEKTEKKAEKKSKEKE